MKKIILVITLSLSLAGCANFQNAWNILTGTQVSPTAVYVAENAFDSVEVVATAYLVACHKNSSAFAACTKAIESKVVGAVRAGRTARNNLRSFMVAHPDALGAQGLYDALTNATSTLNDVVNTYNLTAVKS